MAVCTWCDREMRTASSCSVEVFRFDGLPMGLPTFQPGRTRSADASPVRCGDCGVAPGGSHHPGRDMARCPVCRGQLITCGCRFDEDGPPDEELDEDG